MVQVTGGGLGRYATGPAEVCRWCRSQVEALVAMQVNSGETSSEVDSGETSSEVDSGETSSEVDSGETSSEVDSGETSSEVDSGETSSEVDSGETSSEVDSGETSSEPWTVVRPAVLMEQWTVVLLFASSITGKHYSNTSTLPTHLRIYLSKLPGKATVLMTNSKKSKEVIESTRKSKSKHQLTLGTLEQCLKVLKSLKELTKS